MDKRFAIFDMDGTLVDSMVYWGRLATEYLESKGIRTSQIPRSLSERIKTMTMAESSAFLIREFGLPGTPEAAATEMNTAMAEHYRKDIPLKAGVQEYLHKLSQDGVRMCVASATAEALMEACLRRLGILEYFEFLLSCESVGVGKSRPDVYHAAAKRLCAVPQEAAVFEDAIYAAKTAKEAGYYVVGVYDESAAPHWAELEQLADEVVRDWRTLNPHSEDSNVP